MLRYDNETEYKTVTGGIITISIIILVTIGFASMITDTLNKTAISSSLNVQKSNDPTFYNLIADSDHNFMFGISIQPMDLSFTVNLATGPRYFDVTLETYHVQSGVIKEITSANLVQCTD